MRSRAHETVRLDGLNIVHSDLFSSSGMYCKVLTLNLNAALIRTLHYWLVVVGRLEQFLTLYFFCCAAVRQCYLFHVRMRRSRISLRRLWVNISISFISNVRPLVDLVVSIHVYANFVGRCPVLYFQRVVIHSRSLAGEQAWSLGRVCLSLGNEACCPLNNVVMFAM